MSVIKPDMIMTDSRGHEWRTAPGYQDREPNAAGWLLLRSSAGEELSFGDAAGLYGFAGPGGRHYLRAALAESKEIS